MFTDKIKAELKAHALAQFPKEACGLVVVVKGRSKYMPCRNIHEKPEYFFYVSPEDFVKAESIGEIVAVAHSHPITSSKPSVDDEVGQAEDEIPWIIYSVKDDTFTEFSGCAKPPLYGRQYSHGSLDCLSFVRDFYLQEMDIFIKNYHRDDEWWNKGQNLYLDNYEAEGFYIIKDISEMQYGDLLLLTMQSNVVNHGAIYLGKNKVGHHLTNRLSSVDIYGDFLRSRTRYILRHKDVKKD